MDKKMINNEKFRLTVMKLTVRFYHFHSIMFEMDGDKLDLVMHNGEEASVRGRTGGVLFVQAVFGLYSSSSPGIPGQFTAHIGWGQLFFVPIGIDKLKKLLYYKV